ncbi:sulfotransferase [Aquincola sp. S2]|uniref:Sulfotransferase n=1 Tax=Pseudaquabacterium terrae TaxID=2732868 RepID=A0ABX2EN09_9BURK|nr:sulfotransferase [Aquabacterium terrae]NRF70010.1 sulfotransferase [Aquabacterium terrae]
MLNTTQAAPVRQAIERLQWTSARGIDRIDLSERGLLDAARCETGLEDFGDDHFLTPLRRLLAALHDEAELNPFGERIAHGRTLGSLKNRLWARACLDAHPEIAERRLVAPIIIVGPHRSGTTRLHRLLAADRRLAHLRTWEGMNPAPRRWIGARAAPDDVTTRRVEAVQALAMRHRMYPESSTMHAMHADWPEEEMLLLNHEFVSFSALGLYDVPGYYRWFIDADKTAAYRSMAEQLKLVSWARGDADGTRWVLKNPQHMLDLPVLLATFPDAKIVFTHRDPLKTVGSMLSMALHFAVQHTDRDCRTSVRDTWLDFFEQTARRCMQWRGRIPADQQLDLHYEDMESDWRGQVRRIYHFAGLDFDAEAERSMADWLDRDAQAARHVGHRYALEDFGLTRAAVDERMRFVRDRYSIGYEGVRAAA